MNAIVKSAIILCALLFLPGCFEEDTSPKTLPEAPTAPDYLTSVRFINGVTDVPGSLSVLVDGVDQGTMALGATLPYRNLPAGYRQIKVQGDTTSTYLPFSSDSRCTVFIMNGSNPQFHTILSVGEGNIYVPEIDTARVFFINLSPDTTVAVWRVTGTDTVQLNPGLASGETSVYYQVPVLPIVNEFILTDPSGTIVQVRSSTKKVTAPTIDRQKRRTIFFYDTKANLQIGQIADN